MSRTQKLLGSAVVLALMLAVGGFALWYTALRDDSPEEVNLADALSGLTTATPAATAPPASTPAATTPSASAATPAAGPAFGAATPAASRPNALPATPLTGLWRVVPGSDSFVGYRVREELVRIGAATAVGRTRAVTATLEFDGRAITAVRVEADLTQLRSDSNLRDNALRQQALETGRFPTATFVLTQPIDLGGAPAEHTPIRATATGDLTLHGVTRQVSIPLEGQLQNGRAAIVGSTEIRFADYNIAQPRAASVLSVEDRGTLEIQLVLEKAAQG